MSNKEKSAGELRRQDLERLFSGRYPQRLPRPDIIGASFDWSESWSAAQFDNALHVMKKRGIVIQDGDGYQLRTAPAAYNARMVAERNAGGEKAPEAVKVSTLDEKPINDSLKRPTTPTPEPVLPKADPCDSCEGRALVNGQCGGDCSAYGAPPINIGPRAAGKPFLDDLDPIAVRNAVAALNARLAQPEPRSVDNRELKLEVLDYLGRILDDSIEAVLRSIAGDLQR
jgi:hypothetical protein